LVKTLGGNLLIWYIAGMTTKKKTKKKPKSEKALKNDIRARIRQLFVWYSPNFKAAKNRAKISFGLYQCELCNDLCKKPAVDHVNPVVPIGAATSDMPLDEYFARTFCSADNLQVLCDSCHSVKTKEENKKRVEARK